MPTLSQYWMPHGFSNWFSLFYHLDLASGYWLVQWEPYDKEKTGQCLLECNLHYKYDIDDNIMITVLWY